MLLLTKPYRATSTVSFLPDDAGDEELVGGLMRCEMREFESGDRKKGVQLMPETGTL